MNRRLERIKQDSAKADEVIAQLVAEGELTAVDGQKPSTSIEVPPSVESAINTESEPVETPVATETSSANETQEPQDTMIPESKYKSAVKAMNAAQKERAEFEKTLKEILEQNETFKRELESIKNQKKEVKDDDDFSELFDIKDEISEWEEEFPKTAKIAEKKALVVREELNSKVKTVEEQLQEIKAELEEAKIRKQVAERDSIIKEVHADYDDVRLSDEFREWIYGSAPSIYKGVYEGTIPFEVRDVIKVLDDYKSATSSSKKTATAPAVKKVAAAEMPVKTTPTVSANMQLENVETFTEADFMRLSSNIHRIKDPAKRAELMKKADAFFAKQFKT